MTRPAACYPSSSFASGYDIRCLGCRDAWERRERCMQVNHHILRCIVYVGHASNGPFVAHGTGFMTVKDHKGVIFQQVVTAKYVIEGIRSKTVHLRLNDHDGLARVIPTA